MKMIRIKILPTQNQKKIFKKCFGATRYIYNKCVDKFKEGFSYLNFKNLRKELKISDEDLDYKNIWLKQVPYDTRQLIIKEFSANIEAAFSNLKAGNIKHFSPDYKSKKDKSQIFHVDNQAIRDKKLIIFIRRQKETLKTCSSRDRKTLKKYFKSSKTSHDFRIQLIGGNYYILLPKPVKQKKIKNLTSLDNKIVALDPGVRTFQTFYSPNNLVGKIHPNWKLYKYNKKLNDLNKISNQIEELNTLVGLKKNYIKPKIQKLRTKIKNLISDFHWKTAKFLCQTFDVILLPKFEVKGMIKKNGRKINKTTVKEMVSLSHYTFQQRLIYKAKVFGKTVKIVNESYTSKTCNVCGVINQNLGGNKVFTCSNCKETCDRDYHAGRGIFLKNAIFS